MLKCKINNISVEVEEGTTVIQAFKKLEQEIAHYCWHPGLSIAGVCRLCMVEIEGRPKLEIACNTQVQEGMVITNQSQKVREAVRWGLEFHLINHPLDCPICDQAGECALQEQYVKFGNYDPLMAEHKVKKRKAVDLGSKIVLDTERCILCTRCTRFTDEISKTKELGIFNRGDHSEIGIFKDKPLENNYALNTVDICPVGALTSKKFRFQQRVWYLKKSPSVCTGCSTGCNVNVYYNEEGLWRLLPRYNKKINQHWMCDKGRETFQHVNKPHRALNAFYHDSSETQKFKTDQALKKIQESLQGEGKKTTPALVLTGQYTCEEYDSLLSFCSSEWGLDVVYHWKNYPETFDSYDGFLIRGDKNPNTKGLLKSVQDKNFKMEPLSSLENKLESLSALIVCGPENPSLYPCLEEKLKLFLKSPLLVWIAPYTHRLLKNPQKKVWTLPSQTYFEKSGTFINGQGVEQKIKAVGSIVPSAYSLDHIVQVWKGVEKRKSSLAPPVHLDMKTNYLLDVKGNL